jgi:hypothetical protein
MSIAAMLGLTGYKADERDMIAGGLASHYVGGPYKLNLLERALMDINSREYQNLHPKPSGLYGREDDWGGETDVNLHFHNVAVGNLIQNISEYDAAGADEYGCHLKDMLDDETGLYLKDKDPSLTLTEDRVQLYAKLESELVNWAATFTTAFADEATVPGILERLREISSTKAQFVNKLGYEEDVEVADMAQSLINEFTHLREMGKTTLLFFLFLLTHGIMISFLNVTRLHAYLVNATPAVSPFLEYHI